MPAIDRSHISFTETRATLIGWLNRDVVRLHDVITIQPLASISRDFSREIEASKMAARIAWSSDDGHRYFMRAIIAIPRYAAM